MGDWQGYIDNSLIGSGNMHSAAIVGKSDGNYWAYGGDYIPQPDEVQHILKIVADPDLARAGGFKIATQKYFVVRAESGCIVGKLGAGGACFAASKQAVVIGVCGEGTNLADTNKTVQDIAKYLEGSGY